MNTMVAPIAQPAHHAAAPRPARKYGLSLRSIPSLFLALVSLGAVALFISEASRMQDTINRDIERANKAQAAIAGADYDERGNVSAMGRIAFEQALTELELSGSHIKRMKENRNQSLGVAGGAFGAFFLFGFLALREGGRR